MIRRRYLHRKDLNDKCWNIKSLTIDIEDIEHIPQDRSLKHLINLYTRIKRINLDENINFITILNNNGINLSYIYEIINYKWMVNTNKEINSIDTITKENNSQIEETNSKTLKLGKYFIRGKKLNY